MERFCVECRRDEAGACIPQRLGFLGALQDVVEIIDQWPGEDHHYFRVRTANQALFLVRRSEIDQRFSLVLFEAEPSASPKGRSDSSSSA